MKRYSIFQQMNDYLKEGERREANCNAKHRKRWKPKTCYRCRFAGLALLKSLGLMTDADSKAYWDAERATRLAKLRQD